jgi:hypothetical protein
MANDNVTAGSNSYEKVDAFRYSNSLSTNKNSILEEIKYRFQARNACYYSV